MNRRTKGVDYKVLHKTGDQLLKASSSGASSSTSSSDSDNLEDYCNDIKEDQVDELSFRIQNFSLNESANLDMSLPTDRKSTINSHSITNQSGITVITKEESETHMMEISVAMQTLADDIDDFIEESDISGTDISEVNDVISRTRSFGPSIG